MAKSQYDALRPRMRHNLRVLYRKASPADIREGLAWYPTAVAGCLTWSRGFGVDARTIACIIAAISPQCDWTLNLRIAFELLSGQTLVSGGALRANVFKARQILVDRAIQLTPYFVDGPKVRAFAANLSGDSAAVTIDAHAVQAALNEPLWRKSLHATQYRAIADTFTDIALEVHHRPCDFQAIIWCAWKRRHTTKDKQRMLRERRTVGGPHGTPGIANDANTITVRPARKGK